MLKSRGVAKICFCAIFRNESKNVYRCLNAAKPLIDFVYICDTGSTDNTVELIKQWGKENDIRTHVDTKEFKDFGYNRTYSYKRAIRIFQKTDYVLLLDADMILTFGKNTNMETLRSSFDADVYYFKQVDSSIIYDNIRMIKRDQRIRCLGVTHEYWDVGDNKKLVKLPKDILYINDVGDGGHKQDKFERDKTLLETGIYKTEDVSLGLKGRYFFYLAKTYLAMRNYERAISAFKERVRYPCPAEETYYSYYQIGMCYQNMKKMEKAVYWHTKAWQTRPTRAESIYKMVEYYTFASKDYHLAVLWGELGKKIVVPSDSLFVEYKVYNHGFSYLLSIVYFYVGMKVKGKLETEKLLGMKDLPANIRRTVQTNSKFYK